MSKRFFSLSLIFFLPVSIISTTKGTSVRTDVNTTGDGEVKVETDVSSSSSSKTEVSVKNESSSTYKDGKSSSYKKIEIEVNGEKKIIESTNEGEMQLTANETSESSKTDDSGSTESVGFRKQEITISEYIAEQLQKWFGKFFQGLFGK